MRSSITRTKKGVAIICLFDFICIFPFRRTTHERGTTSSHLMSPNEYILKRCCSWSNIRIQTRPAFTQLKLGLMRRESMDDTRKAPEDRRSPGRFRGGVNRGPRTRMKRSSNPSTRMRSAPSLPRGLKATECAREILSGARAIRDARDGRFGKALVSTGRDEAEGEVGEQHHRLPRRAVGHEEVERGPIDQEEH